MRCRRNEVGRWRMLRQQQRKRMRWLENQGCRHRQNIKIIKQLHGRNRRALLFSLVDFCD